MTFFRRRRARADATLHDDVRRSLERHAAEAPSGDFFTERVLAAVERDRLTEGGNPARPTHRPRRAWLPAVAAAAVIAVLAGTELAVSDLGHDSRPDRPAAERTGAPAPSVTGTTPNGPTIAPMKSADSSHHPVHSAPGGRPQLSGVRIVDLTFSSDTDGWALASADCLSGPGTCTALLHTTDGHTWASATNPGVDVDGVTGGCPPSRCATNIRFATDRIGYVYGPDVLYSTVDGGATWQRRPGGAIALESADGNVVRVTSPGNGCPGPCDIAVQTAANGSNTWTRRDLGASPAGAVAGAELTRYGADVYLLVTGNPAGGANDARSTLYRSSDDGRSWQRTGEPCPQVGGETDSVSVTAGANGGAAVLCAVRGGGRRFVAVSTNDGQRFVRRVPALPLSAGARLVGDPAATLLVTGNTTGERAFRLAGNGSWVAVTDLVGAVDFAGFESTQIGRAVTDDGRRIWTTRNGGVSWSSLTLP